MNRKPPKYIEINQNDIESLMSEVQPYLKDSQCKTLRRALETVSWVQTGLKERTISISDIARAIGSKKKRSEIKKNDLSSSQLDVC